MSGPRRQACQVALLHTKAKSASSRYPKRGNSGEFVAEEAFLETLYISLIGLLLWATDVAATEGKLATNLRWGRATDWVLLWFPIQRHPASSTSTYREEEISEVPVLGDGECRWMQDSATENPRVGGSIPPPATCGYRRRRGWGARCWASDRMKPPILSGALPGNHDLNYRYPAEILGAVGLKISVSASRGAAADNSPPRVTSSPPSLRTTGRVRTARRALLYLNS